MMLEDKTESTYERLKRLGVDMTWYDKTGHKSKTGPVPLNDAVCSRGSTYYMKRNGDLYTCKSDGEPYNKVRETGKTIKEDMYICMKCKKTFNEYEKGVEHGMQSLSE